LPPSASGVAQAYPATFFPNASSLGAAATIEIKPGEDRTAIDFSLRPVTVSSISGVVEGPPDALPGLLLRLLPEGLEDLGAGSEVATATLDGTGRFTLFNVPAGSYAIDVRRVLSELQYRTPLATPAATLPSTPGLAGSMGSGSILSGPYGASYSTRGGGRGNTAFFARTKVTVSNAPVANVTVSLRRGGGIHGKVVMDGGGPVPPNATGLLFAEPADGNLGLGMLSGTRPTPDTFQIDGLLGGDYVLRLSGNVMSIATTDGEEHRFKPFDGSSGRDYDVVVTLTDKRTELSGMAADASGARVDHAIVIAFPVEREQWTNYGLSPARLKGSPTTNTGSYRFQSLPAGEYYVIGVPADQGDAWQDPAKLASMAGRAARVKLAWGETTTQNVTVVKVQ